MDKFPAVAYTLFAQRNMSVGFKTCVIGYRAPGKTEAEIRESLLDECKKIYPEKDGWFGHIVSICLFDPQVFVGAYKQE